jgi:hypothetical protein
MHRCSAIMVRVVNKSFFERVNRALLLATLGGGLAVCLLAALSCDIAYWLHGW